jgi:hypothetical protein
MGMTANDPGGVPGKSGNHLKRTTPHGYTVTDHPEPQPTGTPFTPTDLTAALADDPAPF